MTLDQALRIHPGRRWDDWWLLHDFCDVARDGRVLVHRRIFARDGALLASISQEALVAEPA